MTTRIVLTIAFLLHAFAFSFAQPTSNKAVHVGFIYPISTNGVHAIDCANWFSIQAISGVSASEHAFCVAGVSNVVRDSAAGFIAAGVVNVIGGKSTGLQVAGLLNITRKGSMGLQAAGFMNLSGSVTGMQIAGFGNISKGNVRGTQVAGFMNLSGNVNSQISGFINIADTVSGAQLSGFYNIATTVKGTQIGGFINEAKNVNTQVAGFINVAQNVTGSQVAGFINVAKKVKGVQLAGFINIADSSDYPIGIINIIKKGEKAIGVNVDELGTTMATFRSGGKILYGIAGAGYNGYKSNSLYAVGAGLGAHLPLTKHFRINLEASVNTLTDFNRSSYFNTSIRIFPAIKLARVEFFGGPGISFGSWSCGMSNAPVANTLWQSQYYSNTYDLHFGFIAGAQFHI